MTDDIRWHQRLSNFDDALSQLKDAVDLKNTRSLSNLERQGLIQAFEYTYELAWNVIKDFYVFQGESTLQGSRDAFRMAFGRGLIENGEVWMSMIKSRALTFHTYNREPAEQVETLVVAQYCREYLALSSKLHSLKE